MPAFATKDLGVWFGSQPTKSVTTFLCLLASIFYEYCIFSSPMSLKNYLQCKFNKGSGRSKLNGYMESVILIMTLWKNSSSLLALKTKQLLTLHRRLFPCVWERFTKLPTLFSWWNIIIKIFLRKTSRMVPWTTLVNHLLKFFIVLRCHQWMDRLKSIYT